MTAKQPPTLDQIAALSVLGEPSRRALYDYIVLAGDWVGRDAAADAAGIQRGVAAHHLDRLAEDGLLDVDYQRLSGRTGPGAGRPAKVYRRSALEFDIALPPRDYELAGRLLADAVVDAQSSGGDISEAVDRAAGFAGRQLGEAMRARRGRARSAASARAATLDVLQEQGYEPLEQPDGTVVLRNCPF
ncbi:MAG: transcriptional regulator, partial [Candidatus Microthrix parvicella]